MTTFTINDVLTSCLAQAAGLQVEKVNSENPYVTIVTDVDALLPLQQDFDFNGRLFVSGLLADVVKKYGTVKLTDLTDYRVKQVKVIWGAYEVKTCCTDEIFDTGLAIRITEVDDEVLTAFTLRNNYGEPLHKIIVT